MKLLQDTGNAFTHFVACALLNRARGDAVAKVLPLVLKKWGKAERMRDADQAKLVEILRPLGLQQVRCRRLIALGRWFAKGNEPVLSGWPPGAGTYARQSYRILFCCERPRGVKDHALRAHLDDQRKEKHRGR